MYVLVLLCTSITIAAAKIKTSQQYHFPSACSWLHCEVSKNSANNYNYNVNLVKISKATAQKAKQQTQYW